MNSTPYIVGLGLAELVVFAAIAVALLADSIDNFRLPADAKFLKTVPPYPPIDAEAMKKLENLRSRVIAAAEDGPANDFAREYLNQIETVLVDQSREAMLRLIGLRFRLRRQVLNTRLGR